MFLKTRFTDVYERDLIQIDQQFNEGVLGSIQNLEVDYQMDVQTKERELVDFYVGMKVENGVDELIEFPV